MNKYNIGEVAKKLGVSIYTLRYYDSIKLCVPKRYDNQYRFYTEEDILVIKYIQVMKYVGLSLIEIKVLLENMFSSEDCKSKFEKTSLILDDKEQELISKIEHFKNIVNLIDESKKVLMSKSDVNDDSINNLILSTYDAMNKGK